MTTTSGPHSRGANNGQSSNSDEARQQSFSSAILPHHERDSSPGLNASFDSADSSVPKRSGRKPNPASPALRKEQNRAAQRAFRDRKERHLQQLENMIRDLKDQNTRDVMRYQHEVDQLKTAVDSVQSENCYLREVVYAFESALSKGGHTTILQDVKEELYHRHQEKRQAEKPSLLSSPILSLSTPAPASHPSHSISIQTSRPEDAHIGSLSDVEQPGMLTRSSPSPPSSPSLLHTLPKGAVHSPSIPLLYGDSRGRRGQGNRPGPSTREILYKAPPLFVPVQSDRSPAVPTPSSSIPFEPLSIPRPSFIPPGTPLAKKTEYTKHPTVFDELQSSLFPPGTLQSLVRSSMATPQEVVSDNSLFDPFQEVDHQPSPSMSVDHHDPMTGDLNLTRNAWLPSRSLSPSISLSPSPSPPPSFPDTHMYRDDYGRWHSFRLPSDMNARMDPPEHCQPILGLLSSRRLEKELQVLATVPSARDLAIDPKIYELPHDPRIDLIPCPRLRAQMILHQSRYDPEELFQLLNDKAICHGHPLDPHGWQLPDEFLGRFGFLIGVDLERIRSKVWPQRKRTLDEMN